MFIYTTKTGMHGFAAVFIFHIHQGLFAYGGCSWGHLRGLLPSVQPGKAAGLAALSSLGLEPSSLSSNTLMSLLCFSCEITLVPETTDERTGPKV